MYVSWLKGEPKGAHLIVENLIFSTPNISMVGIPPSPFHIFPPENKQNTNMGQLRKWENEGK